MTIILSYIFYFIVASASPLQRRWLATKDINHDGQIHFSFLVMGIIAFFGLFLPFFETVYLSDDLLYLVILAVTCGIAGALHLSSAFTAQKHVEAGITTLVLNLYTPITIVLASLFLNEKLTMIQIMGTLLLLVGMIIVSKKHRIGKFTFDKYFLLMVVSGVALGVLLTAERALQKETGFTAGTMISWWTQFACLGIAVLVTRSKSSYSKKDIGITGFLRFLQALSWVVLVFVVGNLSLVSAITTFKVVIIFIAAAFLLKEREDLPRKIVGSLTALAGLLLMG